MGSLACLAGRLSVLGPLQGDFQIGDFLRAVRPGGGSSGQRVARPSTPMGAPPSLSGY